MGTTDEVLMANLQVETADDEELPGNETIMAIDSISACTETAINQFEEKVKKKKKEKKVRKEATKVKHPFNIETENLKSGFNEKSSTSAKENLLNLMQPENIKIEG